MQSLAATVFRMCVSDMSHRGLGRQEGSGNSALLMEHMWSLSWASSGRTGELGYQFSEMQGTPWGAATLQPNGKKKMDFSSKIKLQ